MDKALLLKNLQKVERLAVSSKWYRLFHNPYKYFNAVFFHKYIYKRNKKVKKVKTITFFDIEIDVLLPASTDIYLTGGKSHNSEIRLAKFLIKNLKKRATFIDVGAHYGYFSLLAAQIVGKQGKVGAFEAAPSSYEVLALNTSAHQSITIKHNAISDSNGNLTFYEFPNLYSEYNSFDIKQYENEKWFSKFKPKKNLIETIQIV